ncbi:F-box only protein 6 [Monomorium pharaonis]|uniref:F-box only protein 6 n=1 Tax=Monomorium pharaonis TaxID=307658 RepID=UPI00063FB87C|nr:F-box only protein 6 [Monomorium pharaonis]
MLSIYSYVISILRRCAKVLEMNARQVVSGMMGQFNTIPSTPRVMFDEVSDNGLVLCDKYLPVEVLIEIFCRADCNTLVNCQLVCKRWKMMMNYVWHKKAEQALGKPLPWDEKMPWSVLYLACTKRPYERNLLKNHSGAEQMNHWNIKYNGGHRWMVEEPPAGTPELPHTEPMFKEQQTCFVTSFEHCSKLQKINLTNEGIHPYILDTYQPPIVISEWYSCRWDCPADYRLTVELIAEDELLDEFKFVDILEGDKQNRWLKVSHVFENYGTGLRVISFEHGGKDRSFWAGHYGSKMAGACVIVKIPDNMLS